MKRGLLIILFFCSGFSAFAKHITGGEVIYDYLGPGTAGNSKKYRITVLLYRDQNSVGGAQMPTGITIAVFNNDDRSKLINNLFIGLDRIENVPRNTDPPCITNSPMLDYTVGYYIFEIDLPNSVVTGFTITYQTCCRIEPIDNFPNGATMVGATYAAEIPGSNILSVVGNDNSPRFSKGISVVCANKKFSLDFSATDPDSDSLSFSLCDAYNGGLADRSEWDDPAAPPYGFVAYRPGFSGAQPLGPLATINASTGIISGTAPTAGRYVVSVCVESFRRGISIGIHRKDFIITVSPCDFAGADLPVPYTNCTDSTISVSNANQSPLNISFFWDFGDGTTSTEEAPTHSYSDTGVYIIKLVVNGGTDCADSSMQTVRIFPTLRPDFSSNTPTCKGVPVQFQDNSFATYGPVNSWHWDFGVPSVASDTSRIKNPVFTYGVAGTYNATLIVGSIKGCIDTIVKQISILDKAPLDVTNDTLICSIDTLQLHAISATSGVITWSPNYMINDIHSFNPLVSPDVTTTYYLSYSDNFGCATTDSVRVRVVDFVTLSAIPDTAICRTDSLRLTVVSDALQYTWTPAATLNNPNIQSPVATPTAASTTYHVVGRIGKCTTSDDIVIRTVPYPKANAGKDTTICFGFNAQLHATGGSTYQWAPTFFLNDPRSANPISQAPTASIQYTVIVSDTLGCPKPVRDTVLVNVIKINANAGPRDTAVVIGQPLQLSAGVNITNGIYSWSPATWLNNPNIANPVSLPQGDISYALLVTNGIGCTGRDTINVKFYRVAPSLYVPSAFTPNGDVTNDLFRPIALGIRSLEYFKVYNRWGELVYSTSQIGAGWDGTYKGNLQGTATFVWYAEATDYTGKKIRKKGSVVLVR